MRFSHYFLCREEGGKEEEDTEKEATRTPRRCPANHRHCNLAPALSGSTQTHYSPGAVRLLIVTAIRLHTPGAVRPYTDTTRYLPGLSGCNQSKRIERPTNITKLGHSDSDFCLPEVRVSISLRVYIDSPSLPISPRQRSRALPFSFFPGSPSVQDPRGPALFCTHARSYATSLVNPT